MTRSSLRRLLLPLVPVYRAGLALREARLRSGREPVRRLGRPVVSIGNLSTGGTGKTPLTIALVQALTHRGVYVDVLSRGYGRNSRGAARVRPAGTAEEFGDEPLVIAREAGVPVYVAAERYEAGRMAEAEAPSSRSLQLHLLDDGFQHCQLARDADILLMNSRDWQDHLLPAGNLREPRSALRRAHVLAIPAEEPELDAEIKAYSRSDGSIVPIWRLRRRMDVPRIAGPIIAFCGIARPEQFFSGVESAGLQIASRVAFPDHHRYIEHDIDCLIDAARSVRAAAFLTTEKDRVRLGALAERLSASTPLETAKLRIEIENEAVAIDWLIARIGLRFPSGK